MSKAFSELYQEALITVNYQLSNSMLCEIGNMEITDEVIAKIKQRMKQIIKKDSNRKLASLIIGLSMLAVAITLAILMLFMFALGQGVILILAGLFTSSLKNMKSLAKFTEVLLKISGALLLLVAGYMYWKVFSPLV